QPERRDLIANLLLEHTRWFMCGGNVDMLVLGRTYSGRASWWDTLTEAVLLMTQSDSPRQDELIALAHTLLANSSQMAFSVTGIADNLPPAQQHLPNGFRYWPSAEIGAFQAPTFHVGFRQYSQRVQDYECLTQMGGDGWNLAYGTTLILRVDKSGSWFRDGTVSVSATGSNRILPDIDMQRLPGTTTRIDGNPINQMKDIYDIGYSLNFGTSPFAGGVGWQDGGVAGFVLVPTYSEFTAKKSLHFFPGGFWSLGSDITSNNARWDEKHPITTTLMQMPCSNVEPELTLDNGVHLALKDGEISSPRVNWFWCERMAIIFTNSTTITVRRRGSVIAAWIDHGAQPKGAGYAYATLPDASLEQARSFVQDRSVHPVRCNGQTHAVRDASRQRDGVVFFEADSCLEIQTDHAAIVYRAADKDGGIFSIQDPLHSNTTLKLQTQITGECTLPNPEVTVTPPSGSRQITIDATQGRIYRFGYGTTGKQVTAVPRVVLPDVEQFQAEATNDPAKTILTVHLPKKVYEHAFALSIHGNRGHLLKTLTDADVLERPSPGIIRYTWNRKPTNPTDSSPSMNQIDGEFRLFLQTDMTQSGTFFSVPVFTADGSIDASAKPRHDLDNPRRPKTPWP
ncbi:MAG: polysaccharide lyase family 8 super-sandwich domain-containing protein, partial [Planctomycetota bacterium]